MARQRSAETRERDAKALGMKQRGLSLAQICEALGYKAKSSAHEAIGRALQDCYREERGQAVQLELERLDDVFRSLYRVMQSRPVKVSNTGKIVVDADENPVIDYGPVVQAAMGIKAVSESRRKLLGLDAPSQSRVHVITDEDLAAEESELDRKIRALSAELAENDPVASGADTGVT